MNRYSWYYFEHGFLRTGLVARDNNLFRIDIVRSKDDFISRVKEEFTLISEDTVPFLPLIRELTEYLKKERKDFSLPPLLDGSTFVREVLKHTSMIPFGTTVSYKAIAVSLKLPGASRSVGNALARNPFPIIIPCHRVIKSGGFLGSYGGGTEMKKRLLLHEGMRISGDRVVI